jgi:uncharacterized protein involved in outer membrane biogenesis
MKKIKKIIITLLIVLVVLVIAAVVVAGIFLDKIVKTGIETAAPPITKTSVTVDSVNLSLLSGMAGINGFVIGNPNPADYQSSNAISLGKAAVSLEPKSLLGDKIIIKSIEVRAPEITFEGNPFGKNNLQSILDNVNAAAGGSSAKSTNATAAQKSGTGKKLEVDDFTFAGAKVTARIAGVRGEPITVTIPDIHFSNLGTGPDGITAAELTQKILEQVLSGSISAVASRAKEIAVSTANDAIKGATDTAGKAINNAATQGADQLKKGLGSLLGK